MAKHYCSHVGCRTLIPLSQHYCDRHKHEENSRRYFHRKHSGGKYEAFYQSTAWTKLARQYKVAHVLCERCLSRGIIRKADICDHIIPIKTDWDKRLDWNNLQSLCQNCHNEKSEIEVAERKNK